MGEYAELEPTTAGPDCGATHPDGWICTRPPAHAGSHAAHGVGDVTPMMVWPRPPRAWAVWAAVTKDGRFIMAEPDAYVVKYAAAEYERTERADVDVINVLVTPA